MQQQALQSTEVDKPGKTTNYMRWAVTILGIAIIGATFVMAIYRKFAG